MATESSFPNGNNCCAHLQAFSDDFPLEKFFEIFAKGKTGSKNNKRSSSMERMERPADRPTDSQTECNGTFWAIKCLPFNF